MSGENEFEISDRYGNLILRAKEESNVCSRQCCDQLRSFDMKLTDRDGREGEDLENENIKY